MLRHLVNVGRLQLLLGEVRRAIVLRLVASLSGALPVVVGGPEILLADPNIFSGMHLCQVFDKLHFMVLLVGFGTVGIERFDAAADVVGGLLLRARDLNGATHHQGISALRVHARDADVLNA